MADVQRWHDPKFALHPIAVHRLRGDPQLKAEHDRRHGLACLRDDWRSLWDAHSAPTSIDSWRLLAAKIEVPRCVEVRALPTTSGLISQQPRS